MPVHEQTVFINFIWWKFSQHKKGHKKGQNMLTNSVCWPILYNKIKNISQIEDVCIYYSRVFVQFILHIFIIITRCPGQLARTTTDSGALKLTTGQNLSWLLGMKYLASVRFEKDKHLSAFSCLFGQIPRIYIYT